MSATSTAAGRLARLALLLIPLAARADPPRLTSIVGSPFEFPGLAGRYQVATVSPDGALLVLSSAGVPNALASFTLDINGAPAAVGWFPSLTVHGTLGGVTFLGPEWLVASGQDSFVFHRVTPSGEVPFWQAAPTSVATGRTRQGIAINDDGGAARLYVNDDVAPNTLSAYSMVQPPELVFRAFISTGGTGAGPAEPEPPVAAARIAKAGDLIFVLNAGLPGASQATLSVFSLQTGKLFPVAGSPFSLGGDPTGLAVSPGGEAMFLGGAGGEVWRYRIGPDGVPAFTHGRAAFGAAGPIAGMAVDPSGRWLAYADPGASQLQVVDAATLAPIERGDMTFPSPADADGWQPTGVAWASPARLLVTHAGAFARVSAFEVLVGAPVGVICRGTPEEPVVLTADPDRCEADVEVASGVVGECTDEGGVAVGCRVEGLPAGVAPVGLSSPRVVKTLADGRVVSCESALLVVDVTPPVVSVSAHPAVLWPPTGRLVPIELAVEVVDACDGPLPTTCEAVSDQPDQWWQRPDVVWRDGTLWLRAERSARWAGADRTYAVTCLAEDRAGLVGTGSATVLVPRHHPRR